MARRSVGPDPDEPSREPDPDRHYEKRKEKRLARSASQRSTRPTLTTRWVMRVPYGVLPRLNTYRRRNHHRDTYYGRRSAKQRYRTALVDPDAVPGRSTTSRWEALTSLPGTTVWLAYHWTMWRTICGQSQVRSLLWRAWTTAWAPLIGIERSVYRSGGALRSLGGATRRVWANTLGRVVDDD